MTYVVTVTNRGPSRATGVGITDRLPGGSTLVGAGASQGSCSGFPILTCQLGALDNGGTARVTIDLRANEGTRLVNTAEVRGAEGDPDASNNTAQTTTAVTRCTAPGPPRACAVSASPKTLVAGGRPSSGCVALLSPS